MDQDWKTAQRMEDKLRISEYRQHSQAWYTYNLDTVGGRSRRTDLGLILVKSIKQIPDQPGLYLQTLSQKSDKPNHVQRMQNL